MHHNLSPLQLVEELKLKGIQNPHVLNAIENTPRHLFVDENFIEQAYSDHALPIAAHQTISQPYVVAKMTELLLAENTLNKVLEIGTGSGYQAAVLSSLVKEVYTVECIQALHKTAKKRFEELQLSNVHTLFSDGSSGWQAHAPYDGIIVTAACLEVPHALEEQLADGARLVIPVGEALSQQLIVVTRQGNEFKRAYHDAVIFVPLLGGTE